MNRAQLFLLAAFAAGMVVALLRLETVTAQRDRAQADVLISQARVDSLRATLRLSRELLAERDALDVQSSEELRNAKDQISDLRDAVRSGERRLSVAARCPSVRAAGDTSTASVDDAAARAELDPAAAERVIRITADGDEGLIALRGLQGYVARVCSLGFSPGASSTTGSPVAGAATLSAGAGRAR